MPLPRVRITVRRMMAAVAVVSLLIAAARMLTARQTYLARAAFHEDLRADLLRYPGTWVQWEGRRPGSPPYVSCQDAATFHEAMRAKWERAARRPWLPVAPDPPGPE